MNLIYVPQALAPSPGSPLLISPGTTIDLVLACHRVYRLSRFISSSRSAFLVASGLASRHPAGRVRYTGTQRRPCILRSFVRSAGTFISFGSQLLHSSTDRLRPSRFRMDPDLSPFPVSGSLTPRSFVSRDSRGCDLCLSLEEIYLESGCVSPEAGSSPRWGKLGFTRGTEDREIPGSNLGASRHRSTVALPLENRGIEGSVLRIPGKMLRAIPS